MFHGTPSVEQLDFYPFGRIGGKAAPGAISESIAKAALVGEAINFVFYFIF